MRGPHVDRMNMLSGLKKAKHAAFLARKGLRRAGGDVRDVAYRIQSALRLYSFDPSRYPLDFVSLDTPAPDGFPQVEVPRIIWCVWSGTNEMSPNRLKAMESIRRATPGVEVRLVTKDNLEEYIVTGHPLHPSYSDLSDVHRSDYLQAYLLHHHGGGYTGVKQHPTSWLPAFERMEDDADAWVVGYRIPRSAESAWFEGRLGREVRR